MHARSVGLIVSGVVFLTALTYGGGAPVVQAQELRATSVGVAPSELPAASPSTAADFRWVAPSVGAPEGQLVDVILPPHRLSFERLRRALPYGTVHNPIARYLTEETRIAAKDD